MTRSIQYTCNFETIQTAHIKIIVVQMNIMEITQGSEGTSPLIPSCSSR